MRSAALAVLLTTAAGCLQNDPDGTVHPAVHAADLADKDQKIDKLNARIQSLSDENRRLDDRRQRLSEVLRGDLEAAERLWKGKPPVYEGRLGAIWAVSREGDRFFGAPLWIGNPSGSGEMMATGRSMVLREDSLVVEAPLTFRRSGGFQESLLGRVVISAEGVLRFEGDVRTSMER